MKNKRVKQMMKDVLFEKDFETTFVHTINDWDFPILSCWNHVLGKEQFSCLPRGTVSITGKQMGRD